MTQAFHIRAATPGDAAPIRAVHAAAFGGLAEADAVLALSESGGSTASLVAVDIGGHVVGHIVFSPVAIDGPHGRAWAEGLAPLGVLPQFQRMGVGTALAHHGIDAIRKLRRTALIVLGHRSYYQRFGFTDARNFGLSWEVSGHERSFMALELAPGALKDLTGVVRYRPEIMGFRLAPGSPDIFTDIQALECLAATRFRGTAHGKVADSPPLPVEKLKSLAAAGGLWTVTSKTNALAGYIAWERLGEDAYVVEVDVHPGLAGARLGAALIDQVTLLAARQGLSRVVLRTFVDIPWNAPYYSALGFRPLAVSPAALEAAIRHEAESGFDMSRRVTMARAIA